MTKGMYVQGCPGRSDLHPLVSGREGPPPPVVACSLQCSWDLENKEVDSLPWLHRSEVW